MPLQMASRINKLSVVDVYDVAASIGKEFEKIIDNHGPDAVTELMPKVINVLEHLEELTTRDQDEAGEVEELKFMVERLQAEKTAKAEEREKYENELEQIEESWRSESDELMTSLTKIQEENRQLKSSLKEKEGQDSQQKDALEECGMVIQLKEKVHQYRTRLRSVERDLNQKNLDVDAMQGQVERLARLNADIRHKTTVTQHRAQSLIQDQVDLEAQLHDKDQEIARIRDKMKGQDSPPVRLSPYVVKAQLSPDDLTSIQDKLEKQGKVVYDSSDPNRPRFTMNELRDVLQERNELKTKLIDVEDQLDHYKPAGQEENGDESPLDYDAPVHGPINKEPDEKLYPDRYGKSGIRKFFTFLVSPNRNTSKSRRHSIQAYQRNSPVGSPRLNKR